MTTLRLIGVSKRFGRVRALDEITFEVRDGEYVCVLGPTGSGKTTLLRIIAGIVKPDDGRVEHGEVDVTAVPPEKRGAVYVPQTYALFPHLTVLENVTFGPVSRGAGEEAARESAMRVLRLVHLENRSDALPSELSGGMQQRVALARGLASGARLLLLDEPLGALDARLRIELRGQLRELAKSEGFTVIHVTHDQEEAMTIGDRILILNRGRVEQAGTPFHVYRSPASIFSAHFVGHTNFMEGTVAARDRDGSEIRLREGAMLRVNNASHEVEEPVVVAVREEKIRIFDGPVEGVNTFRGDVQQVHFTGVHLRFEIRLDNGERISALAPATSSSASIRRGDRVTIVIDPEHSMVYDYPTLGLRRQLEAA